MIASDTRLAPGRLDALRADLADLFGSDARLLAFGRRAAWVLVPLIVGIVVVLFGTGPEPRRNWYGDFLGNDFTQVWVAGRAALEGRAAEPYDLAKHLDNLKAAFGPECRFAWHYPPVFLLPSAAMALLDPQVGYLLWCVLSAALFLWAMRLAGGRWDAAFIAFAHPLVFCNLSYGQNGLFTAGLMTLGLVCLDRRPVAAGLFFGLLAFKPHFAVLAPLLLLLTGRRTALASCLATASLSCLASLALFGVEPWLGFVRTLGDTNRIILQNAAAGLDLNASAFGAVRLAGGPMAAAWAAQAAVAVLALALVGRTWLRPASPELRAAAFLAAAPLLSPYVPVYDLAPLIPATLFLVLAANRAGGLARHERALLALSPLAALIRVGAGATGFSFGLALALGTLACVWWRADRRITAVAAS
ncbi:glycosyltransferase family 87 protein [Methylobacterium aerolatum]|uniref:DUF2029 domain-containing protein n=1 Tax=Methylobacterium aerolatum TaxID=418708 RepID=A0ABU0HW21_9HYPH|nr:glycosyltransferase family 87 protein [Methylobacterium aerolatum]MDQ0445900.1 hypothetical protein [Methylobacterium aerolatum]GJD35840.1 hypothetical protein FMGBMHLM_2753 [Methylobacterium aerolatum]